MVLIYCIKAFQIWSHSRPNQSASTIQVSRLSKKIKNMLGLRKMYRRLFVLAKLSIVIHGRTDRRFDLIVSLASYDNLVQLFMRIFCSH